MDQAFHSFPPARCVLQGQAFGRDAETGADGDQEITGLVDGVTAHHAMGEWRQAVAKGRQAEAGKQAGEKPVRPSGGVSGCHERAWQARLVWRAAIEAASACCR